jgi:plastocyanin
MITLIPLLFVSAYCFLDGYRVEVINGVGEEEDIDYNDKTQYFDRPNVTIYQGDSVMWQWDATHNVVQVYSNKQ